MKQTSPLWLRIEFALLFLGLPLLLYFFREHVGRGALLLLVPATFFFFLYLRKEGMELRFFFTLPENPSPHLRRLFFRFAAGMPLVLLVAWAANPSHLFFFPTAMPALWLAVLFLYPLLSAYPQELIYRAFFFRRYAPLFPQKNLLLLASALAFALVHLFYANSIAFILSLSGGFLFAHTYRKSGSLLLAAIEHALWGDFLFTIGLGRYFYSGAIGS